MPYLPQINSIADTPVFTNTFGGYDHHEVVQDGEMYDETNISGKDYPALSTRQLRGVVQEMTQPLGILAKAALVTIDGTDVFLDSTQISGITLSTAADMLPKQIVSMGAYVCIFPDNVYFNSVDTTDYGPMGASWTQSGTVTISMCKADGTAYAQGDYVLSATAPANPVNGTLWVDTSSSPHVMKVYAETTSEWTGVASTYVRISGTGIGTDFNVDDAVAISGIVCPEAYVGTEVETQLQALNETMTIYGKGTDYIVVAGILDYVVTQASGMTAARNIPKLDYVIECDNRLWGCVYGRVNGQTLNEIHACAQGDFRNWYQFAGLSTDSYTASCGTDGPFTGAAVVKGDPIFFKEQCLHRVSGSMPSTYQIVTTMCRGVQDGSWRSLAVVGEYLLYKSRTEVMLYDGSLPQSVSAALGDVKYYDAVAGAFGDLYYISMRDADETWHMFVFNTARATWHREDNLHALCFATLADELYVIDADSKELLAVNGTVGTLEDSTTLPWSITFGAYGYDVQTQKYLSKYILRVHMTKGSRIQAYMQYDSSGTWEPCGDILGTKTISANIPVIPRRCDHCQLKLVGTGECKLFSIGRSYRGGSTHGQYWS